MGKIRKSYLSLTADIWRTKTIKGLSFGYYPKSDFIYEELRFVTLFPEIFKINNRKQIDYCYLSGASQKLLYSKKKVYTDEMFDTQYTDFIYT